MLMDFNCLQDGKIKDAVKKHQTNERGAAEEKAASSEEPKNNGIRKVFIL